VLVGCVAVAVLGRAALLKLDAWPRSGALPEILRRPQVRWGAAALALIAGVAVALALSVPSAITEQYGRFVNRDQADTQGDLRSRLTNPDNNGRVEQWRVAIDGFREQPLHGYGAGTYALRWDLQRPRDTQIDDAHSLYAEVLGELGIVGLVLVVMALLLILGGFLALARGRWRSQRRAYVPAP